jgi:hypothetical protein
MDKVVIWQDIASGLDFCCEVKRKQRLGWPMQGKRRLKFAAWRTPGYRIEGLMNQQMAVIIDDGYYCFEEHAHCMHMLALIYG